MDPVTIVTKLIDVILGLMDRGQAKALLDKRAVQLANMAAEELEKAKFGAKEQPQPQT